MTDEDREFAWIDGKGGRASLLGRIADWVGDRMDDIGEWLCMALIGFFYAFIQFFLIALGVAAGCTIANAMLG